MDFSWSDDDLAFEAELVAFLDERLLAFRSQWERDGEHGEGNPSGGVMGAMGKRQAWQHVLNEGRWAAILWPEEWGGRAATVSQNVLYTQTMARYRTPGIYNANGIVQIGPAIIQWGTEEQKARWLPSILDASEHWCQCFSEPQAGSDLANLRTTALPRRRSLRGHRREGVDFERADRTVGHVFVPHRPRHDRPRPPA